MKLWRPAKTGRNFVLSLVVLCLWSFATAAALHMGAVLLALISMALGCVAGLYIVAIS